MRTILKKFLTLLLKIWLTLFAISYIHSIIERMNKDNKKTITKGKWKPKEWKPEKWKKPDFPAKEE